eukprot:363073-Chlamydomonas_euryale.AAC.3
MYVYMNMCVRDVGLLSGHGQSRYLGGGCWQPAPTSDPTENLALGLCYTSSAWYPIIVKVSTHGNYVNKSENHILAGNCSRKQVGCSWNARLPGNSSSKYNAYDGNVVRVRALLPHMHSRCVWSRPSALRGHIAGLVVTSLCRLRRRQQRRPWDSQGKMAGTARSDAGRLEGWKLRGEFWSSGLPP